VTLDIDDTLRCRPWLSAIIILEWSSRRTLLHAITFLDTATGSHVAHAARTRQRRPQVRSAWPYPASGAPIFAATGPQLNTLLRGDSHTVARSHAMVRREQRRLPLRTCHQTPPCARMRGIVECPSDRLRVKRRRSTRVVSAQTLCARNPLRAKSWKQQRASSPGLRPAHSACGHPLTSSPRCRKARRAHLRLLFIAALAAAPKT